MRKKVVSMLLATIMAASMLAGCGSGSSESSGDAGSGEGSGTSDEAYDLTLYSINTTDRNLISGSIM